MAIYKAPTENYFQDTLNEDLDNSETTITLSDTTGLQFPGVITINRKDSNGTLTPELREDVSYTGISSNDLTGCTRGVNNSGAKTHSTGAIVEATLNPEYWNDMLDLFAVSHNTNGSQIKTLNVEADAATITFDLNDGLLHQTTIADNRTLAISNEQTGQVFILKITQGVGAPNTVTWFSTIKWEDGEEPELSQNEGESDIFVFTVTGTDTYDGFHASSEI